MIFDRAIRGIKNETISLDSNVGWEIGAVTTGTTQSGSMKISAVNACVECITNSMSKLPFFVINNTTKEHITHPVLKLLAERPNEAMTPSVYKKLIETNRLLHGNGYSLVIRDVANARPRELIPLPSTCVLPKIDDFGRLWYVFTNPNQTAAVENPNLV